MKKLIALLFTLSAFGFSNAEIFSVKSPDGRIEAKIADGSVLKFSATADGKKLLEDCGNLQVLPF